MEPVARQRVLVRAGVALVALGLAVLVLPSSAQGNLKKPPSVSATVVSLTDGDTVVVRTKDRVRVVELIGIDAPEPNECGGSEATSALGQGLHPGAQIVLKQDRFQKNKDAAGNLLRYVGAGSGGDYGNELLMEGWAAIWADSSPFNKAGKYALTQSSAMTSQYGVWKMCGGDFHRPL